MSVMTRAATAQKATQQTKNSPLASRPRQWARKIPMAIYLVLVVAFLVSPMVTVVASSVGETPYLSFPPEGFTLKWYGTVIGRGEFVDSLRFSLWIAAVSATIVTVVGFLTALALNSKPLENTHGGKMARLISNRDLLQPQMGGRAIRSVVLSPMMLPVIVLAVAFLHFFALYGMSTEPMSILLSHLILTLPFGMLLCEVGIGNVPPILTRAGEGLGASRLTVLRRVVVPLAKGGIAAAWAFAFVVSFGDSTIALLLQGPGNVTVPVEIFNRLYAAPFDPIVAALAGIVTLLTLGLLGAALAVAERGGGIGGRK